MVRSSWSLLRSSGCHPSTCTKETLRQGKGLNLKCSNQASSPLWSFSISANLARGSQDDDYWHAKLSTHRKITLTKSVLERTFIKCHAVYHNPLALSASSSTLLGIPILVQNETLRIEDSSHAPYGCVLYPSLVVPTVIHASFYFG